ncbi:MAG: peptidoglycan DD-metalloendopeptidase family protein [Candidatus Rokubacteria bacterium]|nr:peptidoglycan DD-metalloendopeptidase family protein [Candidatus Rokubacteria bacterium]
MTRCRTHARRAIGIGLLVPGLLLVQGSSGHAEAAPLKSSQKRALPRAQKGPEPRLAACAHVVQAGDSVNRIAARYRVTRQALIVRNRLARPGSLRIGQRLDIPGCQRAPAATPTVSEPRAPLPRSDGTLLVSAGPRRVPTRFFLAVPEFNGRSIDFTWPVLGPVLSGFGQRRSGWHAGIDIRAEVGTPVLAAAPGIVYFSGWQRSYGRIVRIEHDNDFTSVYAHNLQNFVEAGDRVDAGTVIGTVGRSGRATAYHLHFEIRHEGLVYNPLYLLPARDVVLAGADEVPEAPEDDDEDE